jgi:transposase-like protein
MPRKTFTTEQVRKLSKNKHISHCGLNTVRYSKIFRQEAVRQYEAGLTAVEIFQNAEIDLAIIGKYSPNHLMHQWRTALKPKQPKNTDPLSKPHNNMERLRAEVVYLREENRFLAQLRARKKR